MSFGASLYNGLPLVHWALLRLASYVVVLSQGHMFLPKLTAKGWVLLRNGRHFLCCNVWSPVFWMICTFGLLLTVHRMIFVLCCLMVVSNADSLLYMMYTLRPSMILSGSWLVLRSGMNASYPPRGRATWTYPFEVPTATYEYVNDENFFSDTMSYSAFLCIMYCFVPHYPCHYTCTYPLITKFFSFNSCVSRKRQTWDRLDTCNLQSIQMVDIVRYHCLRCMLSGRQ